MLKCTYMTYNIYSMVVGSTSVNILLFVLCRCMTFFKEHEMTELEDCGFVLFYVVNLFCDNTIYYACIVIRRP